METWGKGGNLLFGIGHTLEEFFYNFDEKLFKKPSLPVPAQIHFPAIN
jgi:hypothetical protein